MSFWARAPDGAPVFVADVGVADSGVLFLVRGESGWGWVAANEFQPPPPPQNWPKETGWRERMDAGCQHTSQPQDISDMQTPAEEQVFICCECGLEWTVKRK